MDLMRPHLNRNYHLTVDNWFASPKLFHDLRDSNTYATGTCLKSRIGMPKSFKTTNLPRGQMCVKSQGNLMAILYSDRKHVTVITTTGRSRYDCYKIIVLLLIHINCKYTTIVPTLKISVTTHGFVIRYVGTSKWRNLYTCIVI